MLSLWLDVISSSLNLDLKQLGEHLLSGQVDVSYYKQLETLAQRLERERAEIVRQLWGR